MDDGGVVPSDGVSIGRRLMFLLIPSFSRSLSTTHSTHTMVSRLSTTRLLALLPPRHEQAKERLFGVSSLWRSNTNEGNATDVDGLFSANFDRNVYTKIL